LIFWTREARKRSIADRIDRLKSIRISTGASNEDFLSVINDLQNSLFKAEGVLNKLVKQNWENLKIKKRG